MSGDRLPRSSGGFEASGPRSSAPGPASARGESPGPYRVLFVLITAIWLVLPFAVAPSDGPDGITFAAAGMVDPSDVYPDSSGRVTPEFLAAECSAAPSNDCTWLSATSGHFVSPPLALPLLEVLAPLGVFGGRLLASGCVVATMLLVRSRSGDGPWLVAAVALMTFSVIDAIGMGQNAPLLALTVALWLRPSRRVAAVALALCVALKAWPIVLVSVFIWKREWRAIGWFGGALALLTAVAIVTAGADSFSAWWTGFWGSSDLVEASPINVALQTMVGRGGLAVAIVLGAWGALRLRRESTLALWSWSWPLCLLALPVVWSSYLLVLVPAAAGRAGRRPWILAGVAAGLAGSTLVSPVVGVATSAGLVLWMTIEPDATSASSTRADSGKGELNAST